MAICTILCSERADSHDSGGFRSSASAIFVRLPEQGVHFRNPINGDPIFLDPEKVDDIQHDLGSDIVMIFDECTPYPADQTMLNARMEMCRVALAKRSRDRFDSRVRRMRFWHHSGKGYEDYAISR